MAIGPTGYTATQLQPRPIPDTTPQKEPRNDLSLSWEIGWEQMGGIRPWMQGVGSALLEKAGFEDAARGHRMAARRSVGEMSERIAELESMYSGPSSFAEAQKLGTIGSYAMWGINEAIKQVPNLAVMALGSLATMGVGTLAFGGAQAGARFWVARALQRMPGAKYIDPATGVVTRSTAAGSASAGVMMSSALLNTGEIYSSALLETGENNPAVTGLAGLLAGSLDLWPGSKIIRNMGRSQDFGSAIANKFLRDKKWRSRLYRSLELGATEGIVEDWQTVIEAFTVNYLNDNDLAADYVAKAYGIVPITAEQVAERMEARAAGVLLGTLLGPFGRVGGRKLSRRAREAAERARITAEDLSTINEQIAVISDTEAEEFAAGMPSRYDREADRPFAAGADVPIRDLTRAGLPVVGDVNRFEGLHARVEELEADKRRPGFDADATTRSATDETDPTTVAASAAINRKPLSAKRLQKELDAIDRTAQEAAGEREMFEQIDARLGATEVGEGAPVDRGMGELSTPDDRMDATLARAAALARRKPFNFVGEELERTIRINLGNEYADAFKAEYERVSNEQLELKRARDAREAEAEAAAPDAETFVREVTEKNPAPDSPAFTTQKDIETAFLVQLSLIKQNKDLQEAEEVGQLQKDVLLSDYLEATKRRKLKPGQALPKGDEGYAAILKNADVTLEDLGLDKDSRKSTRQEMDAAVRAFIGEDVFLDLTMAEALEQNELFEQMQEVARLKKLMSNVRVLDRLGEISPELKSVMATAGLPAQVTEDEAVRNYLTRELQVQLDAAMAETERLAEIQGARRERASISAAVRAGEIEKLSETERKEAFKKATLERLARRGEEPLELPPGPRKKRILGKRGQRVIATAVPSRVTEDEPVTVTTEEEEAALKAGVKEEEVVSPIEGYQPSDRDFETYAATEKFWELVGSRLKKRKGTKRDITFTEKEIELLKKIYPKGDNRTKVTYYDESDMAGDITVVRMKEEIKERTGKTALYVSPAGTYVVQEKPDKKTILLFKRDKEGNVIKDKDGEPTVEEKQVTERLPERLVLYDHADQKIAEQFVDDERNIRLQSAIRLLRRKYGTEEDSVPMKEVAKLAREYGINTTYLGVVVKKGRAQLITLNQEGDIIGLDKAPAVAEKWFEAPTEGVQTDYIYLGQLSKRYQELIENLGIDPERAWARALRSVLANVERESALRYEQIIWDQDNSERVEARQKRGKRKPLTSQEEVLANELDKLLEENDAIFDEAKKNLIIKFAEENKAYLTDPTNRNNSLSLPPGAKEVSSKKILKNIADNVNLGTQIDPSISAPMGYSETRESALSRFSETPRKPNVITAGTKVTLSTDAWHTVFKQTVLNKTTPLHRVLQDWFQATNADRKIELSSSVSETADKIVGEIIDGSYTVIRREGDSFILEGIAGMPNLKIHEDLIMVQKHSESAINRLQKDQLVEIREIVSKVTKQKRVVGRTVAQWKKLEAVEEFVQSEERAERVLGGAYKKPVYMFPKTKPSKQPWRTLAGKKIERIKQAFIEVDRQIAQEIARVEGAFEKGRINQSRFDKETTRIEESRTLRVYKLLASRSSASSPMSLPKDIQARITSDEITYKQGEKEFIKRVQKRLKEEPKGLSRAKRLREFMEDQDKRRIGTLRTSEGKWQSENVVEPEIRKIAGELVSGDPAVLASLKKAAAKMPIKELYGRLQDRFDALQVLTKDRAPTTGEEVQITFEGRVEPSVWSEGKYWMFVPSDEVSEDALRIMNEAAREVFNTGVYVDKEGKTRRTKSIRVKGGRWVNAVPVKRWKNAYGVIIDQIEFQFLPNGANTYDIWEVFEVNDPFSPQEFQQFASLKDAKKVFEKPAYYEKLHGQPAGPPVRMGRKVGFPLTKEIQQYREYRRGIDTKAQTLSTDKVLDDASKTVFTVKTLNPGGATGKYDSPKSTIVVESTRADEDLAVRYLPGREKVREFEAAEKLAGRLQRRKRIDELQEKLTDLRNQLAALAPPTTPIKGRTIEGLEEIRERLTPTVLGEIEAGEIDTTLWKKVAKAAGINPLRKIKNIGKEPFRAAIHQATEKPFRDARQSYINARVDALRLAETEEVTVEAEPKLTKAQREKVASLNRRIKYAEGQLEKQGVDLPKFSIVLESEYSEEDGVHYLFGVEGEVGSSRDDVVDLLGEAFGRQIFNFVTVVQSGADLPLDIRMNRIGYDAPVRGVTFDNQIWLVADALPMNRVVPVALHEIGGHGMQAVTGQKFYAKLLKQVAALVNTDDEIGAIYDRVKAEMNTQNEALILEETMAYIIENEAMKNTSFWRTIVDAILYGLARIKLWVSPSKVSASDILVFAKAAARKHAQLANNGDSMFTANFLNTFLYSGDFGSHDASESAEAANLVNRIRETADARSETGFYSDWFERDVPPAERWWENLVVFRKVGKEWKGEYKPRLIQYRIRALGKKQFQVYVAPDFVKWVTDYFNIFKLLEKSIEMRGGKVTARNSPSLFHGLYKNRVNDMRKAFHRQFVVPLQDFMLDKKVDGDDLFYYLWAAHAPSRNRIHAARAKKSNLPNASGMFTTKKQAEAYRNSPEGRDAGVDAWRSAEGTMEALAEKLGGTNSEGWANLQKAAQQIYKINAYNLNLQFEYGLLNMDTLTPAQKKAYIDRETETVGAFTFGSYKDTYVPLKGQNKIVADAFFAEKLGPSRLNVSGVESRAVTGRRSEPENIWAWSVMQTDYEIDRAEKNVVIMSFAQLIRDNQEDLKDFATVVSLEDYKKHKKGGKLHLGLVPEQQTNPNHNVHFKVNGHEWVILMVDKRLGQAFNRTNMTDSGAFLQFTSQLNRYFSAVHTALNPEFVLRNFVVDMQTAFGHLEGLKETVAEFQDTDKLSRQVLKDVRHAAAGLKRWIRDEKADTPWSAQAKEMSEMGGRIDFFAFKDVRDFEKTLRNYIADTKVGGARRFKNKMIDFVSEYNAVVENTMRLAVYKNAKEAFMANGMSEIDAKRKAAQIAQNLTVNFSQKGEKGAALNSLYLFFNASVQGTARLFQALYQRPVGKKGMTRVQKLASSIVLYSFAQGIWNSLLAGDDEDGVNRYEQIDLRSRSRQGHIYLPGFDTFFKVPLPYGYNIFHVMGDTLAALVMGQTNPSKAAMHIASAGAESFMPFSFGSSENLFKATLSSVSPTFMDPLVDLALNESYFGQPIYKDPVWGSSDPPSERYWGSTGEISKGISRSLNWLSGGSQVKPGLVSIPPDIFEFLWETGAGGAGRFLERSVDLVWNIGPGDLTHRETGQVKWNQIPFARRFFFDETATKKRYTFDKYSQYERAITTATGMEKGMVEVFGRSSDHYKSFKESDDYRLYRLGDARRDIVGAITKLQKERNALLRNRFLRKDVIERRVERLEDKMMALRVKLIQKVDDTFE